MARATHPHRQEMPCKGAATQCKQLFGQARTIEKVGAPPATRPRPVVDPQHACPRAARAADAHRSPRMLAARAACASPTRRPRPGMLNAPLPRNLPLRPLHTRPSNRHAPPHPATQPPASLLPLAPSLQDDLVFGSKSVSKGRTTMTWRHWWAAAGAPPGPRLLAGGGCPAAPSQPRRPRARRTRAPLAAPGGPPRLDN